VDLYLSGTKGLAALNAAVQYPHSISTVRIMSDSGLLNDPYSQMVRVVEENGLNLVTGEVPITDKEALAVGWKFLIKTPYERLFVIHDSLLPKYRGWNPLVTALQQRDPEIGVTLILADEQVDHGPIVLQERISVTYPLKIADAMQAVENAIKELVEFLLKQPDRQNLLLKDQDENYATYSIWRNEEDYKVDWTDSAENILTFIDSVSFPYNGASTTLNGRLLRILSARVVPDLLIINRTPGKVWKIENGNFIVLCGSGLIEILEYHFENEGKETSSLISVKSKFV
jgi:methionyl-tRNA formyltransferase